MVLLADVDGGGGASVEAKRAFDRRARCGGEH